MAWVETRITRTSQPQDVSGFASSSGIPTPTELWLPANSARGLVNAYEPNVEASFVTQPNTGGKGIKVTATGRRYPQQNILNSSTHRAWVVVAYRNFGGGGTQSIVRKDGALTPLQESSGVVNAAHFFSGLGLRITKYPGSETVNLEGRVNVFTGYGDSSDCFIALNHGDEASVGAGGPSLNSTTNPLVFGSAENGGEVASSWVIMAVGLWQGVSTSSIPTRKQLKSFRENPWRIFEPEVSRIWVDDAVTGGAVTGNASGSFSAVSLSPVSGTASGSAYASASLRAVSLSAINSSASGAGVASGVFAPISLSAVNATASGSANASASISPISLSPVTGTASGETVVAGNASGAFDDVALSPVSGTASGAALATGVLSAISLTAINGTASGGAIVAGNATGAFDDVSLTSLTASAFGGSAGIAAGVFASLSINPATGAAYGAAVAVGSLPVIALTPLTGSATGVSSIPAYASGAFDDITLSPLTGTAAVIRRIRPIVPNYNTMSVDASYNVAYIDPTYWID